MGKTFTDCDINNGTFINCNFNNCKTVDGTYTDCEFPRYCMITGGTYDGVFTFNEENTIITGGTFYRDVSAYVAEVYYSSSNEDGTWTVVSFE